MHSKSVSFAVVSTILVGGSAVVAHPPSTYGIQARDGKPSFPFDKDTISSCTFWYDNDGSMTCEDVISVFGVSMDNFVRWNPSVTSDCENFLENRSYCMEAKDEPVATTATETPSSITSTTSSMTTTTKTTPPHTSTKPDNGIETPHPIQPEMVSNCSKFYWVKLGDKCEDIAGSEGIPVSDLVKWNPKAGEKCTGLWADTYACVSVIGYVRPTPTTPPNGVQTPSPTQKNMVANCNKFRWVYPGESCTDVATKAGVSVTDLARWNPNTGSQCTGLWADAYACVGVIPSVRLKTRWGGNCGGGVHDEVALEGGDGICVNTGCAVGGLEIAPEGYCPDGEVRISYWGGSACDGAWYGYGYASRGQCRTLWSGGYKFKSLYLRCAKKDDDCVTKGECTFEPEPTWNLC